MSTPQGSATSLNTNTSMAAETSRQMYRQIRALFDDETITVYQAYNGAIAKAAVAKQSLVGAADWRVSRMTWIKPSWMWMMYRSGFSYKDNGQSNTLALRMRHADFEKLLLAASLSHGQHVDTSKPVRVQWDPERDYRLEKLDCRSIQIGISGDMCEFWAKEMVVEIEDVTANARAMKKLLDEGKNEEAKACIPEERVYKVSDEVRILLAMDLVGSNSTIPPKRD